MNRNKMKFEMEGKLALAKSINKFGLPLKGKKTVKPKSKNNEKIT